MKMLSPLSFALVSFAIGARGSGHIAGLGSQSKSVMHSTSSTAIFGAGTSAATR